MAVALIVVGPEKLPELAKTVAKQLIELKKAASTLKESFQEELKDKDAPYQEIHPAGALPHEILTPEQSVEDSDEQAEPDAGEKGGADPYENADSSEKSDTP